jgi:diketogulonate reductase-like aldo/keto reductase
LREGKARAIGVSDYPIDQLEEILRNSVVPAVNGRISTIYSRRIYYVSERRTGFSWKLTDRRPEVRSLTTPNILAVAKNYGKTPAQVLIRWSLQI